MVVKDYVGIDNISNTWYIQNANKLQAMKHNL